jgi:DNA polymerase I-like protein with 3'-5' exonuclease and polymerase domains
MKLYGIDIETHDPCLTDRGVSWVYGEGSVLCTGLYQAATGVKKALPGAGGATVRKLLLDKNVCLVGANIVYDLGWLCYELKLRADEVRCGLIDVALAEACIDEYQNYSLDALARKYLNEAKGSEPLANWAAGKGLRGDFRKHLKQAMREVPDLVNAYVISDADQPVRIWEKQHKILQESGCMAAADINFRLIRITLGMKQRGVRIDMKKREQNRKLLQGVWDETWADFERRYGKVNLNSPLQLAALFTRVRVPFQHRITIKGYVNCPAFTPAGVWNARSELKSRITGLRVEKGKLMVYVLHQHAGRVAAELAAMGLVVTNNPSLAKEHLKPLRKTYPLVGMVLDLKLLRFSLENFFGPNMERFIVRHGNGNFRMHPDFNIVGARQTGRFSSANPNGQNIPSRTVLFDGTEREIPVYKLCREVFIPDDDMWMCKLDFSGQENRLMAHFAVGPKGGYIRRMYNQNPDFDEHDLVGAESGLYEQYGKSVGRKYIKNYRFGKAYGMQIPTMMAYFGWTREHAEHMDNVFNDAAPWVRDTMDKVSKVIIDRGYVVTVAGRRCHLERFNGKVNTRSAYKGFNKLIQGSGADLMKKAMIDLEDAGLFDMFPLYLTIHDELVIGVPKTKEALKLLPTVAEMMEKAYRLTVPMRVEPELGPDWGHTVEFSEHETKFRRRAA